MGNCCASSAGNQSRTVTEPFTPVDNKLKDDNNSAENRGSAAGVGGGGVAAEGVPPSGRIVTPNLKTFTYAELKSATRNFRPDTVVGEGGFGKVFKGWIDRETYAPSKVGVGMPVAVKKSFPDNPQALREWQAEVKFLGKFSHPNLVKLLGYCWEKKQFLLVYEYMENGSLESHLFKIAQDEKPLSWEMRLKIVIEAAQGLAFLHTTEKQVIYRDFKAGNILLDGDFNAKLADFGLAKLGPVNGNSHVTTGVVGTYGYAAPEYIATGHLYVNSDIYGFGVVLLELLTGRRVLDLNRPTGEHNLIDWAWPSLSDKRKVRKIMDPMLENQYPSKAALQAAELIQKCLESDPKSRPSMEQVLVTLQQINAIKISSKKSRDSANRSATQSRHLTPPNHHLNSRDPTPLHHKYGGNGIGTKGGSHW